MEGDRVLRCIAETLAEQLRRAGDFLARYNGGTFGVLFPGVRSGDGPRAHCETLRAAIEELDIGFADRDGSARKVTMSGGLVLRVPDRGETTAAFTAPAAEALRRAKAQGRNRIESA
jgi:diguanylate cyclase (GGDEF)-like protein